MSIRKKRNFRDLQLPVGPGAAADADGEPVASRLAPLGPRKRPPPLKENGHGPGDGDLDAGPDATSLQASLIAAASLDPKPQYKEFDLKNDDFNVLEELGQGNGGSVVKVQHVPTGTVMAKKIVLIDAKPAERKKILRELQIMHDCDSPWIVASYGAYLAEPNICICMEFMDKPSFDGIYKRIGAIEIGVVGRVAVAVLEGLRYLYDVHRIIHRDIKPSNILCNSNGDIKLCDFGVSGELVNSIANTFVGTSIYMSPERIQGAPYSVKSDVWSLGITLIELSVGQFPFSGSFDSDEEDDDDPSLLTHSGVEDEDGRELPSPPPSPPPKDRDSVQLQLPVHRESLPPRSDSLPAHRDRDSLPPPSANHNRDSLQVPLSATTKRRNRRRSKGVSLHGSQATLSILELMHAIINEPSPRLPRNKFDKEVEDFVGGCLEKDPEKRGQGGLGALFEYPWIRHSRTNGVDMRAWAATF